MTYTRVALAALFATIGTATARADVVISTAATQNMDCSSGTCVPTSANAILNVNALENDLSQFGNVRVMTTGSGVEANNIVVKVAFSSPDSTSLTLDAHKAVTINAAVSIGAGTAELEVQGDTGEEPGTLLFGPKGNITFGSLSDIFGINGNMFTLVGSLPGLVSAVEAHPGGNFALANSYDASQDGTYIYCPIGVEFDGILEGLGNTISRMVIKSRDSDVALFYTVYAGIISDLRLSHARVEGRFGSYGSGVAVLTAWNFGTLFNDSVDGTVEGKWDAGGIVAFNVGLIAASVSSAAVTVTGKDNGLVGGIAGFNQGGTISASYATGFVTIDSSGGGSAGDVAGANSGAIDSSFGTGPVSSSVSSVAAVGGLVGANDGTISNSYASGSVFAPSGDGGGLIGIQDSNFGTSTSSYSTSPVAVGSGNYAGGFVGYIQSDGSSISDGYWDTDTSGIANLSQGAGNVENYPGITGLTTVQFQSGLPVGFDPNIWAEKSKINNGLPYLIANPPPK